MRPLMLCAALISLLALQGCTTVSTVAVSEYKQAPAPGSRVVILPHQSNVTDPLAPFVGAQVQSGALRSGLVPVPDSHMPGSFDYGLYYSYATVNPRMVSRLVPNYTYTPSSTQHTSGVIVGPYGPVTVVGTTTNPGGFSQDGFRTEYDAVATRVLVISMISEASIHRGSPEVVYKRTVMSEGPSPFSDVSGCLVTAAFNNYPGAGNAEQMVWDGGTCKR